MPLKPDFKYENLWYFEKNWRLSSFFLHLWLHMHVLVCTYVISVDCNKFWVHMSASSSLFVSFFFWFFIINFTSFLLYVGRRFLHGTDMTTTATKYVFCCCLISCYFIPFLIPCELVFLPTHTEAGWLTGSKCWLLKYCRQSGRSSVCQTVFVFLYFYLPPRNSSVFRLVNCIGMTDWLAGRPVGRPSAVLFLIRFLRWVDVSVCLCLSLYITDI